MQTDMVRKSARKPLSRERIVQVAIELLDALGEDGLTFRTLAAQLETGPGAIYWHVANKDELLAAAIDDIVAGVMAADSIRAIALGLFDAIDAHPWVGAQLSRAPGQAAMLQIFERFGAQVQSLRVPEQSLFAVVSTLVSYVLGVASQNAANARNAHDRNREAVLAAVAVTWSELDPVKHPFMRQMAEQLRGHDDRAQFLAGIDLILAGIASGRAARTSRAASSSRTRARR
jgi:AcrR family transcriptional regulator